tara:strand:- start:977 stop:1171 length:195 start_codon:yes stop_codon:yes gene_type:complete
MKLSKDFFKDFDTGWYQDTAWGSHWDWSKSAASKPGGDDALRETSSEFTGFRLARKEDEQSNES